MGKAKLYGMNKPYIKNSRADRIHLKNQMHFARGSDKQQRSMELFLKHLARVRKDKESLEEPYTFVALPRRGGKMAYVIQKALQAGGAIAVTRKETKKAILQTAAIMGVKPPEVVVLKKNEPLERGITFAGVIVDIYP
ncbi:MAG: hypothetical protein IJX37_07685 [Oscillospiraceae bacterium]|nr:hypothetical protein [Oscillospiraceae bacterium]